MSQTPINADSVDAELREQLADILGYEKVGKTKIRYVSYEESATSTVEVDQTETLGRLATFVAQARKGYDEVSVMGFVAELESYPNTGIPKHALRDYARLFLMGMHNGQLPDGFSQLFTQAELDQKVAEGRIETANEIRARLLPDGIDLGGEGYSVWSQRLIIDEYIGEVTNPHTPPQEQKTPVQEVRYVREQTEAHYKAHGHYSYQHCPIGCPGQDEATSPPQVDKGEGV